MKVGDTILVTYQLGPYNVKNYKTVIQKIDVHGYYHFPPPSLAQGNPNGGDIWALKEPYVQPYTPPPLKIGDKVVLLKKWFSLFPNGDFAEVGQIGELVKERDDYPTPLTPEIKTHSWKVRYTRLNTKICEEFWFADDAVCLYEDGQELLVIKQRKIINLKDNHVKQSS